MSGHVMTPNLAAGSAPSGTDMSQVVAAIQAGNKLLAAIQQALASGLTISTLPIFIHGFHATTSYANDAAAAAGGVAVDQLYRNGSVLQIRVS